jgi:hypothetical protein
MNATHVHLLLNHVSILGALFSVVVLIWGIIGKDKSIRTVALTGFVLSALAAIPVFFSGESAEEAVENLAGVSESLIESHEETANIALWLIEAAGLLSLITLVGDRLKWKFASAMPLPVLLLAIIASGSIAYTGYLGGKIRHTEISAASASADAVQGEQAGEQLGEDDD